MHLLSILLLTILGKAAKAFPVQVNGFNSPETADPGNEITTAGSSYTPIVYYVGVGTTVNTGSVFTIADIATLTCTTPGDCTNFVSSKTAENCKKDCEFLTPSSTPIRGFEFYYDTGNSTLNTCKCVFDADNSSEDYIFGLDTAANTYTYCYECMTKGGLAPSSQPSTAPSGAPSGIPSSLPSKQPSRQPSSIPSSMPSSMPSSVPSKQPSRMPSSIPSEQPSRQPSSIPSRMPSSIPSEHPSRQPSSIPSLMPSSIPSEQPTRQPSSIPSLAPSSHPSEQPTSAPSDHPSTQPSCTPSMAPTDPATMHLFYPDWSPGGTGCKNDGLQPAYMSASPSDYLHSTLHVCCSTYFGWNYDTCMGNLPGICARALFYPDWQGANVGCIDDGNEPPYMTDNSMYYLFSQLADCCKEHYSWNYDDCVGRSGSMYNNLYYPDWEGSTDGCATGGGQPQYMNNAPEIWMFDTMAECCSTNFQWKYNDCIGTSPGAVPTPASPTAGSGLYYPDWLSTDHVCRNDGNQPAYMTNMPSLWMHATLQACCTKNYSWNYDKCIGSAPTPAAGTPAASPAALPSAGTSKYYMSWTKNTCVRDCVSGAGCGGLAQKWDFLYDTIKLCCQERNWWNDKCVTSAT